MSFPTLEKGYAVALEALGFVPDGRTRRERILGPTGQAPDGEPRTFGGRQRYVHPATGLYLTLGPVTTNVYRRSDKGRATFLRHYRTKRIDLDDLRRLLEIRVR